MGHRLVLFIAGLLLAVGLGNAAIVPSTQQILSSGAQPRLAKKELEIVRHELHKAEIIPTVIDNFIPSLLVGAKWGDKEATLGNTLKPKYLEDKPKIYLHDPVRHHKEKDQKSDCASGKSTTAPPSTYVLALTDPDAPSREDPKWSEFCHWIAISPYEENKNTGHSDGSCLGSLTKREIDLDEIIEYKPPAPPEKTGKHRYVLLAFVPANGTTERIYPSKPGDRKHWGYEVDEDTAGYEAENGEQWWNWNEDKDMKNRQNTPGVRRWARENGLVPVGANFIYAKHE
ncbi:lipid binding protein [Naviculisporaceae sp. PSN 640]